MSSQCSVSLNVVVSPTTCQSRRLCLETSDSLNFKIAQQAGPCASIFNEGNHCCRVAAPPGSKAVFLAVDAAVLSKDVRGGTTWGGASGPFPFRSQPHLACVWLTPQCCSDGWMTFLHQAPFEVK